MIIDYITEENWQIALATQNSTTVEELIDRATALDAIRNTQHENRSCLSYGSRSSPKFQSSPTYAHSEKLHKSFQRQIILEISLVGDVETKAMLCLCAIYTFLKDVRQ
ncbi:hypothetical protein AVEN_93472-1 [Araneus ventricosus]|uniref:Uncharacterized protein n=1 Tax=Araneus ventricosus TaxID=182803 RepID=A0A4Y2AP62_ARAVE|nr:hypothetical protein AVEN_93472-1 [Araneus ventricosus]